jgi:hypothetical protein
LTILPLHAILVKPKFRRHRAPCALSLYKGMRLPTENPFSGEEVRRKKAWLLKFV